MLKRKSKLRMTSNMPETLVRLFNLKEKIIYYYETI